jgi:cytochrome bd-type quinol oxidase subunit 2
MLHFDVFSLIKSLHVMAMALAGGSAMVILVLVGFEDSREDLQGLTSVLWKRTTAWFFRLAVLLGLVLLAMKFKNGEEPFQNLYLHWKLVLVFLLLMFSEMTPRALAAKKRGAPLLAFVLFLLVVFVSINAAGFGTRAPKIHPGSYTGAVEQSR